MEIVLPYDSETTGLPLWKEPSEHPDQPHLVQLAALLVSADTREIKDTMDIIVKPNGWVIPAEVTAIHGISTERAMDEGIPEEEALVMFLDMHKKATLRIGHNQSFDARIIRIAMKRYGYPDDDNDAWKEAPAECTGLLAKPIMQMLPKNRWGYKMPKLVEAYRHFIGEDLEDAHSALADTAACNAVYWAIQDHLKAAAA